MEDLLYSFLHEVAQNHMAMAAPAQNIGKMMRDMAWQMRENWIVTSENCMISMTLSDGSAMGLSAEHRDSSWIKLAYDGSSLDPSIATCDAT